MNPTLSEALELARAARAELARIRPVYEAACAWADAHEPGGVVDAMDDADRAVAVARVLRLGGLLQDAIDTARSAGSDEGE